MKTFGTFNGETTADREALVFNATFSFAQQCIQLVIDYYSNIDSEQELISRVNIAAEQLASILGYKYEVSDGEGNEDV